MKIENQQLHKFSLLIQEKTKNDQKENNQLTLLIHLAILSVWRMWVVRWVCHLSIALVHHAGGAGCPVLPRHLAVCRLVADRWQLGTHPSRV